MGLFSRNKKPAPMENRFKPQVEEPAAPSPEKRKKASREPGGNRFRNPMMYLRSLLDGTLLANEKVIKNIPYILFATGLAILYITNSTTAEKNRRELVKLTEELKELRYKYISTKSSVMFLSNQSQISEKLKETGIKENTTPPVKIFVSKDPGNQ